MEYIFGDVLVLCVCVCVCVCDRSKAWGRVWEFKGCVEACTGVWEGTSPHIDAWKNNTFGKKTT